MSYDNTLKYLVEQFPYDFVKWLVNATTDEELTILKTELSIEPIRADGVIFIKIANRILHLEFQTLPYSDPPIPFRMLDYWIRLRRKYKSEVVQVVIFLQETSSELVFVDKFREGSTVHKYRVIRIWEMNSQFFLDNPGLLPLASLAKSNQPRELLTQIAGKIDTIEEKTIQSNLSACVQLLAGIRFDESLIKAYFKEELMKESVIYQSIKQEGKAEGKAEGLLEGKAEGLLEGRAEAMDEARIQEASLLIRIVKRHLGEINPNLESSIQQLSFSQLEELGDTFLDWNGENDLVQWLENQR